MKKFLIAAALLFVAAFAIPIEHKYDKPLRHYSLTLIPDGLDISKTYDQKIYFFASDLIALALLFMGLFWFRIPLRHFFGTPLWIVFLCAAFSIVASPFIHYPVAYTRLLHLLTPIVLFSFLATAFTEEEKPKILRLMFTALVAAGILQSGIAIAQYFCQAPLGLRLFGETTLINGFNIKQGHRWIFDRLFEHARSTNEVVRASGTIPHPNVLGGLLALSLLITYWHYMKGMTWLALTIPLQVFAMMLTYSRSALFGWGLGSAIWFALAFYQKRRVQFLAVVAALSVSASMCLLYDQLYHRGGVVNYNALVEGGDQIRVKHQNTALKIIQCNPLFGLGFAQFSERAQPYFPSDTIDYARLTAPHNIFLFLACETGLLSLGAFLLFIASLLWRAVRTPLTLETATLAAIFITFLFIGCCDFYPILFQQGKLMFFSIAGLLAAFSVRKKEALLDPPRHEVWKMFDRISGAYDRTNRVLSLGMDQRWRSQAARSLPNRPNLKILDLATGTGDQILALLKSRASIQSVTGIDLSNEMLEIAKKKLKGQAAFLRADAEKLPFQDASFDAATFSFGIRNVVDPLRSLKEIFRVLKPSGRCLILEFSLPPKPIRGFYLFYLRHILPRLGGLLTRHRAAYSYLNQTIEHFPSGRAFSALMEKAGFDHLERVPMSLGGVTLYIGEKR